MRSLWVLAVEHGESVFKQRRDELELALATAGEQLTTAEADGKQMRAAHELLNQQLATLTRQLTEMRQQLTTETTSKNAAASEAHALQQELTALRVESARQLEAIRHEQEKQTSDFQQAIAARDAAFRTELDTATQRLESAQAHMLQQVDDARQGQRRAETHAAKIQQERDKLQEAVAELRMELGLQSRELNERASELESASQEAARLVAEKQQIQTELATARGRIEGIETTVRSLEARALAAETRLVEVTVHRDSKRATRTLRTQQG